MSDKNQPKNILISESQDSKMPPPPKSKPRVASGMLIRIGLGLGVPLLSVVVAFTTVGLVLATTGKDPIVVYGEMYRSAFGDENALADTLVKAIPLILTGLAVAIAFSARLWNIGAEGQFFAGAIAASGMALAFDSVLGWFILPVMFVAGIIGGALWALIPGILRAYLNVNEIISTLMLNYVIILFSDYLIYSPWRDPQGFNFPLTRTFGDNATLATFGDSRVHLGLVFGIVAAVIVGLILSRTTWGFELKVMGDNPTAARYAGINITRNILLVMAFSGGLAGLAGMSEVTGVVHKLQQGISSGYGFTAIIVAWLARLNPWGIVLVAVLFGGLINSGYAMKGIGIASGFVTLIQGAVLFFVLAGEALLRKLYYKQDLKRILSTAVLGRTPAREEVAQ